MLYIDRGEEAEDEGLQNDEPGRRADADGEKSMIIPPNATVLTIRT